MNTKGPFLIDRWDHDDGNIVYEIKNQDRDLVCRVREEENRNALADARLIVDLLNNQRPDDTLTVLAKET